MNIFTTIEDVLDRIKSSIVNNLTSTDTEKALAAVQGKVLLDQIKVLGEKGITGSEYKSVLNLDEIEKSDIYQYADFSVGGRIGAPDNYGGVVFHKKLSKGYSMQTANSLSGKNYERKQIGGIWGVWGSYDDKITALQGFVNDAIIQMGYLPNGTVLKNFDFTVSREYILCSDYTYIGIPTRMNGLWGTLLQLGKSLILWNINGTEMWYCTNKDYLSTTGFDDMYWNRVNTNAGRTLTDRDNLNSIFDDGAYMITDVLPINCPNHMAWSMLIVRKQDEGFRTQEITQINTGIKVRRAFNGGTWAKFKEDAITEKIDISSGFLNAWSNFAFPLCFSKNGNIVNVAGILSVGLTSKTTKIVKIPEGFFSGNSATNIALLDSYLNGSPNEIRCNFYISTDGYLCVEDGLLVSSENIIMRGCYSV